MPGVAVDDVPAGRVTGVDATTFRVARPQAPDVTVPFEAVRDIAQSRVVHNRRTSKVDDHGWSIAPGERAPLGALPLRHGMPVVDDNGHPVGTVARIEGDDLRVPHPSAGDLVGPRSGVRNVEQVRVALDAPVDRFDRMGWDRAPRSGSAVHFSNNGGMAAVGSHARRVGSVHSTAADSFTVDRSQELDLQLRSGAIAGVADRATLNVTTQ